MADQEVRSPEKERQILDGAALAFAEDGYEGASMSRIASMAGVSKGTLYNYFAGKKDLFAAFVQRECTLRLSMIFDGLEGRPDGGPAEAEGAVSAEATLLLVGRRIVDMLLSETGLLMYRMVLAEAHKFPELSEAFFDAGPRPAMERMTELINRLARSGQIVVEDPLFAAEQLFALVQTRLVFKRRMGLLRGATEAEREHVVREAVRLFLRGYGARRG